MFPTKIRGIDIVGSSNKISLFADDILLTLISPRISLLNLLSLLDTFASLSGLRANSSKFKALSANLSLPVLTNFKSALPFHWLSLPYLGIHLASPFAGLYQANFPPFVQKTV